MKFDSTSKDLLAAALYIERFGLPEMDPHPLRALSHAVGRLAGGYTEIERLRYFAAAERLHEACGSDNADLSPEEAIDSLVAAAFWHVPQEEIVEPDGSPDTLPPRDKRDPTNDDHYDGNDDQIDDLKDLVSSLRTALQKAVQVLGDTPASKLRPGTAEALRSARPLL